MQRILALFLVIASFMFISFATDVPHSINYQGKLFDGGGPASGTYDFQVALYDASTDGAELWVESFDDVSVNYGLFNLVLEDDDGGTNIGQILTQNADLWIEVRVRPGSSTGSYTILGSREKLLASPWAITIADNSVTEDKIDWGSSSGQVSADDVPFSADGAGWGASPPTDVDAGLEDLVNRVNTLESGSGNYVQLSPGSAQDDADATSSIWINKTAASGNLIQLQQGGTDEFVIDYSGNANIAGNLEVDGNNISGTSTGDGQFVISNTGNIRMRIDSDDDGSSQFEVRGTSGNALTVTEGGNLTASGDGTFNGDLTLSGDDRVISTGDNLDIQSNSGLDLYIDYNDDGIGSAFYVKTKSSGSDVNLFRVDEDGDATVYRKLKLTPQTSSLTGTSGDLYYKQVSGTDTIYANIDGTWRALATANMFEGNYIENQFSSAQSGAGFWTSGNGRIGSNLYVDGNAGIGTTGPGAKLHVYDGAATGAYEDTYAKQLIDARDSRLQLRSTDDGSYGSGIILSTANKSWSLMAQTSADNNKFYIGFRSSSADEDILSTSSKLFTIQTGGNVGIGTTSPSYKLDVQGTGRYTGALTIGSYTLPTSDGSSGQVLTTDGSGSVGWQDVPGDNWGSQVVQHDGTLTGDGTSGNPLGISDLPSGDNDYIQNQSSTDQSASFRISGNGYIAGNVGIGTSSPGAKLQIDASSLPMLYVRQTASSGADASIKIRGSRNGCTSCDVSYIDLSDWDSNESSGTDFTMARISAGMNEVSGQTGYLRFYTNSGASLTEKMRIDKNGNVGIGTTSPSYKLDVQGTGRYTGALTIGSYTLPTSDGSSGQVLTTDGSGSVNWQDVPGDNWGSGTWTVTDGTTPSTVSQGQSVTFTGGTGISTSQSGRTLTITNTSPDQTVTLTGGTGISISGSYPSFTITNTSPWSSSSNDYIQNQSSTDQTASFRISGNGYIAGNVGIGTTSPGAKLDVEGDIHVNANGILFTDPENGNATVELRASDSSYPDEGIAVRTLTNPTSGEPIFRVISSGGSERLRVEHDGALKTSNYLEVDGTGSSYIMGNVGIGTTSPSAKLDVNGSAEINGQLDMRSNKIVDLADPTADQDAATKAYVDNAVGSGMPTGSNGQTIRHDGTDWVATSNIYNNGTNVGIGTTSPSHKLDVNGGNTKAKTIHADGYIEDVSGIVDGNLVSSHCWTVGSGSVGGFSQNGTSAENVREWGIGPHGNRVLLWKAVPDASSNADGGWNFTNIPIDPNKAYRVSVWIKKTNSNNGTTYLGCNGGNTLNLDGTENTNPYFWSGDLPQLNKWYLIVGYIHANNDPSMTSYGGIYDGETGEKVVSITDFKNSTGTTQTHRSYLYYDTNTSDRQYFWDPRFEEINGHEPSIAALLGTGFDGSGTQNYVAKFNNAAGDRLGNSQIYDNGTNVGIGDTSPDAKLDIEGKLRIGQGNYLVFSNAETGSEDFGLRVEGENLFIREPEDGNKFYMGFYDDSRVSIGAGSEVLSVTGSSVGIGTTSPSTAKLQISNSNNSIWGAYISTAGNGLFVGDVGAGYDAIVAEGQNNAIWAYCGADSSTLHAALATVDADYDGTSDPYDTCAVYGRASTHGCAVRGYNGSGPVWGALGYASGSHDWAGYFEGDMNINNGTTENGYLYFGTNADAGIRNNSGTMQYKNASGSWTDIGASSLPTGSNGQTIRHDGTDWVATSSLYNDGTNVGIGTTSPSGGRLHIKEASSNSGYGIRLENADNSRNLQLWVGTGGAVVDAYTGANLHLRTNGTDRLYIQNSTGNVGIGTTSPAQKLDVNGNIKMNDKLYFGSWLLGASGAWPSGPGFQYSGGDVTFGFSSTGGQASIQIDGGFRQQETGKVNYFMDNVGIGTTSPSTKLHVNGDARVTGRYYDSSNNSGSSGKVLSSTGSGTQWTYKLPGQRNSATISSTGWYRIASNSGNRADATFTLRDQISGGGHSTVRFEAGVNYGDAGGISFTLLNHSRYSTATFTQVRIIENGTYDGAYLEVYCARTGNVEYTITDNEQASGWTPVDWAAGSIPSGWTAHTYNIDKLFVIADSDDRVTVNRGGNVGIGTTSPSAKLDVVGTAEINGQLDMQSNKIVDLADPTNAQDAATKNYVDTHSGSSIWQDGGSYIYPNTATSFHVEDDGDLDLGGHNIERVDEISANNIDPVLKIGGKLYRTWTLDMVGQRVEVVGQAKLNSKGFWEIDLATQPEASDFWLFWHSADQKTIIPFVSPQGPANLYGYMEGSKFIVKSMGGENNIKFSYRLIAVRYDFRDKTQEETNIRTKPTDTYIDIDGGQKYDK